jgi:Leucine-rich repeat (LRR) protein
MDQCPPSTESAPILPNQNPPSLEVTYDLTQARDYRAFRQWLLQQSYKTRVDILEALLRDASIEPAKEQSKSRSTSAQDITALSETTGVHLSRAKIETSAWCLLGVLRDIHEQWTQHRNTQVNHDGVPIQESSKSNSGLAIDLRGRDLQSLSSKVVDMFYRKFTEKLTLSSNRLVNLPENMLLCIHLRHLDLSHNNFEEIPESIMPLQFLTHLDMCHNQLRSIPDEISKLKSLRSFLIANNNIQILSSAIGKMNSLDLLHYDGNPIVFPSQHRKELFRAYDPIRDGTRAAFDSSRTAWLKTYLNNYIDDQPQNNHGKLPQSLIQSLLVALIFQCMYVSADWHRANKIKQAIAPIFKPSIGSRVIQRRTSSPSDAKIQRSVTLYPCISVITLTTSKRPNSQI